MVLIHATLVWINANWHEIIPSYFGIWGWKYYPKIRLAIWVQKSRWKVFWVQKKMSKDYVAKLLKKSVFYQNFSIALNSSIDCETNTISFVKLRFCLITRQWPIFWPFSMHHVGVGMGVMGREVKGKQEHWRIQSTTWKYRKIKKLKHYSNAENVESWCKNRSKCKNNSDMFIVSKLFFFAILKENARAIIMHQ